MLSRPAQGARGSRRKGLQQRHGKGQQQRRHLLNVCGACGRGRRPRRRGATVGFNGPGGGQSHGAKHDDALAAANRAARSTTMH